LESEKAPKLRFCFPLLAKSSLKTHQLNSLEPSVVKQWINPSKIVATVVAWWIYPPTYVGGYQLSSCSHRRKAVDQPEITQITSLSPAVRSVLYLPPPQGPHHTTNITLPP